MGKHKAKQANAGILGLPTHESKPYLKKTKTSRRSRGFLATAIINSTVLYALYWILFACPSGVPSKDAPQVCKRYYNLKQTVSTKAIPFLQPYYEQYAGPYIAKGQPYYEHANKLYGHYAKPVVDKSNSAYSQYVHPVAVKGATAAQSQYNAKLAPIVGKYTSRVSSVVSQNYEKYIGRHVNFALAKYDAQVSPYISALQSRSSLVYNKYLIPAYHKAYPYGQALVRYLTVFYSAHIHPHLLTLLSWATEFLDSKIMPTVRRFYYLHVEPQVSKLTDKIFVLNATRGFSDLEKVKAADIAASVSASILASVSPTATIQSTVIAGETISVEAAQPSFDAKMEAKIQHEVIDELLSVAENNINQEGEGAAAALQTKLDDILPSLVKKEEILSEDYLKQLEKITVDEVASIESRIQSLAKLEENKFRSTDDISEDLRPYFVRAGKNIHSQAVEVKAHLSTVLESLEARVNRATYQVYDQLLAEGQRQKREPEQQLRYELKDVSKKEIKRLEALDDLIKKNEKKLNQIADATLKRYTKTLSKLLHDTEKNVESLAGGAAKKLHTLRNVGPKKITVGDDSESFGHGYLPVGAMLGAQAIYNQLSTGMYGAPEPTADLAEKLLNSIKSVATDLPEHIDTDSIKSAASVAASVASRQGQNAASAISSVIADIDTDALASSASSAAVIASQQAARAASAASSAAQKIDTDKIYASVKQAQEYVGEVAADIGAEASSVVYGTPAAFTESLASRASEVVFGTQPAVTDSIISKVSVAFEAISERASEKLHGTNIPLTDILASKASVALHGTEVPVTESIMSRIHEAYDDVKEKAEHLLQGTEEEISAASKSAASASSSLSSKASRASADLSSSASSASSVASRSASSASSVASRSALSASASISKSAASASSLASKSAASASLEASRSSKSLSKSASSAASEATPIVQSVVDKAWEDYASVVESAEHVVDTIREHIEL